MSSNVHHIHIDADTLHRAAALTGALSEPDADTLTAALDVASEVREKHGDNIEGLDAIGAHLAGLEADYYRGDTFAGDARFPDLDVSSYVRQVTDLPGRTGLRGYRYELTWRRKAQRTREGFVRGKAGATSKRDRDLGAGPFKLELALDVWILATDTERLRLIHHETGHWGLDSTEDGRPIFFTRRHPVEEFPETVAEFGLATPEQGALVAAALAHPETPKRLREYGFEATGQGLLFGAVN